MWVLVWALSGLLASWAIACSSDGATGGTGVDERVVEGGLGFIEAIEERIALVVRRHDDEPVRGEALHHGVCRPSGARVAMRVENHGVLACGCGSVASGVGRRGDALRRGGIQER
jgi:hypothetical protein